MVATLEGRLGLRSCNGVVRDEAGDETFDFGSPASGIGLDGVPRYAALGLGRNVDFDVDCDCVSSVDDVRLILLIFGNFLGL